MQEAAAMALRKGLQRYDAGKGWSGPIATIEVDDQWQSRLASSFIGIDYDNWRVAAVLSKSGGEARIGFSHGDTGRLPATSEGMRYRQTGLSAFSAIRPRQIDVVKQTLGARNKHRGVG